MALKPMIISVLFLISSRKTNIIYKTLKPEQIARVFSLNKNRDAICTPIFAMKRLATAAAVVTTATVVVVAGTNAVVTAAAANEQEDKNKNPGTISTKTVVTHRKTSF